MYGKYFDRKVQFQLYTCLFDSIKLIYSTFNMYEKR